jgi:hypothetical protein
MLWAAPESTSWAASPRRFSSCPCSSKDHAETGPSGDTGYMAKSREQKAPETLVYPADLQLGDRLADERGEWEVIGRPFTTAAGKTAHTRVRKVSDPLVTELRTWGAHERISVKRG